MLRGPLTPDQRLIVRAMQDPDNHVVTFDYADRNGVATRRVVSPIRWLDGERFLGLCLSREHPRQFHLDRCRDVVLAPAAQFLMPVPMEPV